MAELKCPWCGGNILIVVCDDEGNLHEEGYEKDPWSGLGYQLYHDVTTCPNKDDICPIARHMGEGILGTWIYDSREEAIEVWNRRV